MYVCMHACMHACVCVCLLVRYPVLVSNSANNCNTNLSIVPPTVSVCAQIFFILQHFALPPRTAVHKQYRRIGIWIYVD